MSGTPFKPIRILEVELSRPLPAVAALDPETGQRYERATALVRLHHQPLGTVDLHLEQEGVDAGELAQQIWRQLAPQIAEHRQRLASHEHSVPVDHGPPPPGETAFSCPPECPGVGPLAEPPGVTVVVATRDRTASLGATLPSLLDLDYPNYEVLVVDNAPSSSATADLLAEKYGRSTQVRYLREERPGLGNAHNCALPETRTPIVAFTDDDVRADRHWLTELARGFRVSPNVACVTGMIFPMEIESQPQLWAEQYWGFFKGFAPSVFDLRRGRPKDPLFPYSAGHFGSGANMAFKTSVLRQLGGFDLALGAGTVARGGDDLAAFFQVISHGYTLVYQPSALIYHRHRQDYVELRRQAYGYGVGLTAYLTKTVIDRPQLLFDLAIKAPYLLAYLVKPSNKAASRTRLRRDAPPETASEPLPSFMPALRGEVVGGQIPPELRHLERKGMLMGPVAYLRSRRESRKSRPQRSLTAGTSEAIRP